MRPQLEKARHEGAVPVQNLSSRTRTKESAPDERTSSRGIGIMGGCLLGFIVLIIFISDLFIIKAHLTALFRNLYSLCRRQNSNIFDPRELLIFFLGVLMEIVYNPMDGWLWAAAFLYNTQMNVAGFRQLYIQNALINVVVFTLLNCYILIDRFDECCCIYSSELLHTYRSLSRMLLY